MIYCSALRKNEILPFVMTYMDLGDIMLIEMNQIEKDKVLVKNSPFCVKRIPSH